MSDPSPWTVDDVCSWLGSCGIGHLKEKIQRNRVDGASLLVLTKEDIRDELLIDSFIDRKRLWDEVRALQQTSSSRHSSRQQHTPYTSDIEIDLESQVSAATSISIPQREQRADQESPTEGSPRVLSQTLSSRGGLHRPNVLNVQSLDRSGASNQPPSPSSASLQSSFSELSATFGSEASVHASGGSSRAQHHMLVVNEENAIKNPQLHLTITHFTSLIGADVTANSIGVFFARPGCLELLILILSKVLYGLVGRPVLPRSTLENDCLPQSAVTLLRCYGVTSDQRTVFSTVAAARTMQSLPLGRFIRDALRVCDGVSPIKGLNTRISNTDLALFVQIFCLKDELLKIPPPPQPAAPPPRGGYSSRPVQNEESIFQNGAVNVADLYSKCKESYEAGKNTIGGKRDDQNTEFSLERILCVAFQELLPKAAQQPSPLGGTRTALAPTDNLPSSTIAMLKAYCINLSFDAGLPTVKACVQHIFERTPKDDVLRFLTDLLKVLCITNEHEFKRLASIRRHPRGAKLRPEPLEKRRGGGTALTPKRAGNKSLRELVYGDAVLKRSFAVGDLVEIGDKREEVEAWCTGNARVGWHEDMIGFLGTVGRVQRYSAKDAEQRKIQVAHDAATWTWPVEVCSRRATARPAEITVSTDNSIVYSSPALSSPVLTTLQVGDTVPVVEEARNGWCRLHGGGWLASPLTSPVSESEALSQSGFGSSLGDFSLDPPRAVSSEVPTDI